MDFVTSKRNYELLLRGIFILNEMGHVQGFLSKFCCLKLFPSVLSQLLERPTCLLSQQLSEFARNAFVVRIGETRERPSCVPGRVRAVCRISGTHR